MVPQKKKKSVLEIIITAVAVIIGVIAGQNISQHGFDSWRSASVDKTLAQACDVMNKTLPKMVDSETRVDNVSMGPNRTWRYHYTLVHMEADKLDPLKVSNILRPKILAGYQTSDDMKAFRDDGVTLDYQYFDAGGNHITDIEVGPKDLSP